MTRGGGQSKQQKASTATEKVHKKQLNGEAYVDLDIDVVYLHLSPQALVSRDSHESRGRRARRCDCGLASRAFAAEALLPLSEFLQGVCPAMGGQGARLAPRGAWPNPPLLESLGWPSGDVVAFGGSA